LRKEHRLNMFCNTVPRKLVGPEGDKVTGYWRIQHYEELDDLYCSTNINRVIRTGGGNGWDDIASMGGERDLW
jgi:hypothetical protein